MFRYTQEDIQELIESTAREAAAKNESNARATSHAGPNTKRNTELSSDDGSKSLKIRGVASQREQERDKYSADREENDERRSRRMKHVDALHDHFEGDDKDRLSANGSLASRRRTRSPDPRRRSSGNAGIYRQRDRPARGDFYNGGGRPVREDDNYRPGRHDDNSRQYERERSRHHSRDRSWDRHHNSHGRDRSYDRRRDERDDYGRRGGYRDDRDDRDDRNDRGAQGGRRGRRPSPEPKKPKTPEPTDDERDRRTIFVQQLAARLRTKDLKTFFEQVGPVVEAQIVKDRVSNRSKGVGYVEFKYIDSVERAIQLTGQKLLGIPIIAQLTEAEKNRQARNNEGAATQSNGVPFHRLYVGNIHFSITEDDLKNIFEPFGELEFVQLQKEEGGRSKGYGFVQFIEPAQAKEALEKMNGFELAGRPIRVGLGNDKFTHESTQAMLHRFGSIAQQAQFQGSAFSGAGGRGAHAGGTSNFDRARTRDADKTSGASALDDTDVAGVNFSNYSRDALMRKLARIDEPEQKIAPKTQVKPPVVPEQAKSRCVMLRNMFSQANTQVKGWKEELEEDVKTECNDKYGQVVHIDATFDNDEGEVYIKFDRVQGGENAIRGLNGRWFDGRMISAQYIADAFYNAKYPKAAKL